MNIPFAQRYALCYAANKKPHRRRVWRLVRYLNGNYKATECAKQGLLLKARRRLAKRNSDVLCLTSSIASSHMTVPS